MTPDLVLVLQQIAQTQQQTFVTTVAAALVYVSVLGAVWWSLARRLDARHDETRRALADLHATSQAIVAQTAELLRRTQH
jgi:hypothetical protein